MIESTSVDQKELDNQNLEESFLASIGMLQKGHTASDKFNDKYLNQFSALMPSVKKVFIELSYTTKQRVVFVICKLESGEYYYAKVMVNGEKPELVEAFKNDNLARLLVNCNWFNVFAHLLKLKYNH